MKLIIQLLLLCLISNIFTFKRVKKAKRGLLSSKAKSKYSSSEVGTTLRVNGGSWSQTQIIYLKQIDGPTSYPDIRGIVFSSNFGQNTFDKYTYNNGNAIVTVYYLPYRNLNSITCNSYGSNRAVVSDGTYTYEIWLNFWESECNIIANFLDKNRRSRQSTLAQAARDFATYGQDYVSNLVLYEGMVSGQTSINAQITSLNEALAVTKLSIVTNTKLSINVGATISSEEKKLSDLNSKSSIFQAIIDSNATQKIQIQAAIDRLKLQGVYKASTKNEYELKANDNMTTFKLYSASILVECPTDSKSLIDAQTNLNSLNVEAAKALIISIIPI